MTEENLGQSKIAEQAQKLDRLGVPHKLPVDGFTKITSFADIEDGPEPPPPVDALKFLADMLNTPSPYAGKGDKRLAGYRKIMLVKDLAAGVLSRAELADKYEVNEPAIKSFAHRYANEISQLQAKLIQELDLLWSQEKINRLAEYQQDVDDINELLTDLPGKFRGSLSPSLFAKKHAALRSISEELGQLPTRVNVTGATTVVNYSVEGVDLNDLR